MVLLLLQEKSQVEVSLRVVWETMLQCVLCLC